MVSVAARAAGSVGVCVYIGWVGVVLWDICLQLCNTSPPAPLSSPKLTAISCMGRFITQWSWIVIGGCGWGSTLGNDCGWWKMASIFVEKGVDEYSCSNKQDWYRCYTLYIESQSHNSLHQYILVHLCSAVVHTHISEWFMCLHKVWQQDFSGVWLKFLTCPPAVWVI